MGAVVNLPLEKRPWGSISWLADVYGTSRETVYQIGERSKAGLLSSVKPQPQLSTDALPEVIRAGEHIVWVNESRMKRTILSLVFPGGVTLRPIQVCLQEAFDLPRSVGYLSELINEAGEKAGQILDNLDYDPLGEIIAARDETYLGKWACLLTVEPKSYTLLSGHVEESCDSVHWGVSLALDCNRGAQIVGLAEDAAKFYAKSLKEAGLLLDCDFSPTIQKDVWHAIDKATNTVATLERLAMRKIGQAEDLFYKKVLKHPEDHELFEKWGKADAEAESLVELSDQVRFWVGCICDGLEMVDWRSGEIRDREINEWLLTESLTALRKIKHFRVRSLVTYVDNQMDELLTFLDWLELRLLPWQAQLAAHLPDLTDQTFFQKTVAQAWRLQRAVSNGQTQFKRLTAESQDFLALLVTDDPQAHLLAEDLLNLLESVIRTSCAAETVNSILKPYLRAKRSFQSRRTAQHWLNLFLLWFNMHLFERSKKRKGKSPFQLAGITVYTPDGQVTHDWLAALGYSAN